MKRKIIGPVLVTALRAGLGAVSCQAGSGPELCVVSQVDLNRYLGRWYEIAAFLDFLGLAPWRERNYDPSPAGRSPNPLNLPPLLLRIRAFD